ncbi:peptidylprolyl isomerase [Luminiphilus sp.]|nr:peptidyl-prolyl cis-trans isomerase [Luminiphilus sp.]MDC6472835.1 peptidylprolyl isomerase [Luminiphilus sp.]
MITNESASALAGLLILALLPLTIARADEVILSHEGVQISFSEAFAYSLRHTNPDAYAVSMSKPQATFRVVQNLYVYKRVASLMEASPTFSAVEWQYLIDDFYRRKLLARYLDDAIAERMTAVDWEGLAKAEFAQRKARLTSPEEVRAEHLLVSMEEVPFDAFVSKVRAVQEQLSLGADFADLVAQYSDDSSAVNNGDLGFFSRKRMQPSFSKAAFALTEPGEIVGPVMTRFGAHFIRFIDRREEQPLTFDEVESRLIEEIKKETEARLREELLVEVRDEIESDLVTIDERALLARFLQAYEAYEDTLPN